MEFNTTLHNIKMEGGMSHVSGWPVSATAPLQDKKVSQFFPWAIFNAGAGFYIPTQPGSGTTPPSDLSGRSFDLLSPRMVIKMTWMQLSDRINNRI